MRWMNWVIFLCGILCMGGLYARATLDVYGASQAEEVRILKKYTQRVLSLEERKHAVLNDFAHASETELNKLHLLHDQLIHDIKQEGPFAYVQIDTVEYPESKQSCSTIEVVHTDAPLRLNYIDSSQPRPSITNKKDLITHMEEYQDKAMSLLMNNELNPRMQIKDCPAYHCLVTFKHPQLSAYLPMFNQGAKTQKPLIIHTLTQDKNPNRRAAAVYLVGHFQSPSLIISTLLPHVNDPSESVRNNVMRVLGMTMQKADVHDIDPMPFLQLLNSPYVTDRNKALYVLLTTADSKRVQSEIIKHGKRAILANLALKQPNNHEVAYSLLKKISHKSFGEWDQKSWHQWFKDVSHYAG